jgi:hypothetical protein
MPEIVQLDAHWLIVKYIISVALESDRSADQTKSLKTIEAQIKLKA